MHTKILLAEYYPVMSFFSLGVKLLNVTVFSHVEIISEF